MQVKAPRVAIATILLALLVPIVAAYGDSYVATSTRAVSQSSPTTDLALGAIMVHFFQVSRDGAFFADDFNDSPVDTNADDLDTETVSGGAIGVSAQGDTPAAMQRISVEGNSAIDGDFDVQSTTHVWYRGILAGKRLYQIVVEVPIDRTSEFTDKAARFIQSFTLG